MFGIGSKTIVGLDVGSSSIKAVELRKTRTGIEVAQTSLWFGVDDLDGTVQEEKIYHMAGARTPEAMTPREIERLIRAAGRDAVQRDTLYNVVAL